MPNDPPTETRPAAQPPEKPPASADQAVGFGPLDRLQALLKQFDGPPGSEAAPVNFHFERSVENQLIEVRLGTASSLYRALRWKHEPTAQHCLRVTLSCSAWSARLGLPAASQDELELAALLHDIGKIGVPDNILTKPGSLTEQEAAIMESHWLMGLEILRSSCASPGVLDIISTTATWFDGSRNRRDRQGRDLPLGARMLAIADAFDAMVSDHVYRRAFSCERAFNELYRCAGTQFDPALIKLFTRMHEGDQAKLRESVSQRWLAALEPRAANSAWRLNNATPSAERLLPETVFQQKLLANMFDAVVFVDTSGKIFEWNHGAERLTGISAAMVYQRRFLPSLLELRDEHGEVIRDEHCPVAHATRTGVQWFRRLSLRGRRGRPVAVDAHALPVVGPDGVAEGLALLFHDVSPEISLEARCETLHDKATKDPLTQVANRAEFDRAHPQFIEAHLEKKLACSLIIMDIDRFKLVNDTYGHQAGDEVIQSFARLLKSHCRSGDLVARYGGEEFVVLCADCDLPAAVRRAEELRKGFSEIPQSWLGGKTVTASFGVTQIQPGDTAEIMLRRADRALLSAKENGRNRVVQLGSGDDPANVPVEPAWAAHNESAAHVLVERCLVSEAPWSVCIDKIKGFVADQHGVIESAVGDDIRIRIGDESGSLLRRMADRPLQLVMDLRIEDLNRGRTAEAGAAPAGPERTRIQVAISPLKHRDRRTEQLYERAKQLLVSFRCYLMATECDAEIEPKLGRRSRGLFNLWFGKGKD